MKTVKQMDAYKEMINAIQESPYTTTDDKRRMILYLDEIIKTYKNLTCYRLGLLGTNDLTSLAADDLLNRYGWKSPVDFNGVFKITVPKYISISKSLCYTDKWFVLAVDTGIVDLVGNPILTPLERRQPYVISPWHDSEIYHDLSLPILVN